MKKVKERRAFAFLMCLAMIVSLFPAPMAAQAAPADAGLTLNIMCASQNVGTAYLSREGAALVLKAEIHAASEAYMTRVHLKTGDTTIVDSPLTGDEQRAYTRVYHGVDPTAAAFALDIDLAMPGSGEQTTSLLSGKNTPDAAVVEQNSANNNPDHAWNRLVYEPESQKLGTETFGAADPDGFVTKVLKGTGAQWVYPVADSASRLQEGGYTAKMQGRIHIDDNRIVKKAVLMIAADDGYAFRVNGTLLPLPASSDMVIGADDAPMEKVVKPPFPNTAASFNFQHVAVYDLIKEGVNLKPGDNPYAVSVFNQSEISGVIFALRITTAPLITETFHQTGTLPSASGGAVRASFALLRVNGAPVSGSPAVAPGDRLSIGMTLKNEGAAPVYSGALTVTLPIGLRAESPAECRVGGGARLVFPESTALLAPSQSIVKEFDAVVEDDAYGALTLRARMPSLFAQPGDPLPNAAADAELRLSVASAPLAAADALQASVSLRRVSGAYSSGTSAVRAGDRLDFVLRMENRGGQPVRPEGIEITLGEGLTVTQSELEPGWQLAGNRLTHVALDAAIAPGQAAALPFTARVLTGAAGSVSLAGRVLASAEFPFSANYAITATAPQLFAVHKVVRVDNGNGWGTEPLQSGGRVLLRTTFQNRSGIPVRPKSVRFEIPKGLEAWRDDNPQNLWRAEGNSLILQEGGMGLLLPEEAADVFFILRASPYMEDEKIPGMKTVTVKCEELININGDTVTCQGTLANVAIPARGKTPEYRLEVSGSLLRVDDQAVASGGKILPGARLTFALRLENKGNRPVRPKDFAILLPSGLCADPRDNSQPMWTADAAALNYAHGSDMIAPSAAVTREFALRVRDDAQPGSLSLTASVLMLTGPFGDAGNASAQARFSAISVGAAPECAVEVTQTLHRINDVAYGAENHTIRTGDTVSILVSMENRGSREARLEAATFTLPFGLQFINATPEARWTIEENRLTYTPDVSETIASGHRKTAIYHLRVGVTASGVRSIPCAAAQVLDNTGARQPNAVAATAARLYVDGVTGTYKLAAVHKLVRINGSAVTDSVLPRPGDLLTFELRLQNQGNQPVYPKPLAIAYTDGFTAEGNANPPWSAGAKGLTYAYPADAPIPAGETRTAEYALRLGLNATGTQRVESAAPALENGDHAAVNNAASAARLDIEVGPALAAALRVTHKLLRVNGQEITGAYSARPGDELILEMTLKNAGRMALYPQAIALKHSEGLYAQAGDNPSPWTLADGALRCDLGRKRIDPEGTETIRYVLHVRDDAKGDLWVETNVPKVVDDRGCEVENDTAEARETIVLLPPLSVSLVVSSRLARINDQEVPASYAVRPGDKLTFEMSLKNAGQKAVKPKALSLSWSQGLYLQESDNENPPWVKGTDGLDYVHEGATIAVGAAHKRFFSLRVRGDALGEQSVEAKLAQVVDAIGATLANESPEAQTKLTVSDMLIPSLRVTHRLSRINGVTVGSVYTIHPGDKLTFTMVLENDGNAAVRPDAVKVNYSSGLIPTEGANSNPPWSLREGALLYTHEGGTIPAGGVRSVEYGLTVGGSAKGQQRVDSSLPDIMNAEDKWVANSAPDAKLEFTVVADTGYALLATHRLSKINDIAVGSSYSITPGDKLTLSMSIANVGSKPAKPGTITVSYTSGLRIGSSDNGNAWRTQSGALVYTHDGAVIGVGETRIVEYVLRVADTAAGSGQTISSSAAEIMDQAGNKVANEQPKSTLQFTVAGSRSDAQRGQESAGYLGLRLVKVNEKAAEGMKAITAGDALEFSLGMINRSQVPARPGEIVVVLPAGMMVTERDAGTGWTVAGNTLRYAWNGGMIAAGETRSASFTARVRDGAAGDLTVTAETVGFFDAGNKQVDGDGNQRASVTVRVGESLRVETGFWLETVNGKGTGVTGTEGTHPMVRVVPGDTLGYTIRATNRGDVNAAPSEYAVKIPDTHLFEEKKNPGWAIVNGVLVYRYSGAMLSPGAHADVELKLTLKKGVKTGQSGFTFTYDLTQVWMQNGETTAYDGHGQAVIPVQIGGFEKLARTGESGLAGLPLIVGMMMLGMGSGLVLRARRRKGR